jgi:tetratricopeptide (TPR) repeat protein
MRVILGWTGRIAFWLMFLFIVARAVLSFWFRGDLLLAIGAIVLAPLTFFLWPIVTGTWWLLLGALVAYGASTLLGNLRPVTWPAPGRPSLGLQDMTSQENAKVRAAIQRSLTSPTPFWDKQGVLREGVRDLEDAAAREPQEWVYWHILGSHYLQLGLFDRAFRAARQALILRPSDQRSLYGAAICLFALVATTEQRGIMTTWPIPNPQQSDAFLQSLGLPRGLAVQSALELFEKTLQLGIPSPTERGIVESRIQALRGMAAAAGD